MPVFGKDVSRGAEVGHGFIGGTEILVTLDMPMVTLTRFEWK